MPRCVVLLRGVNVGGHNRLPMASFRDVLAACGCTEVTTHLQSGNAVVTWDGRAGALAAAVEQRLCRVEVPVAALVRTDVELDAVVEANPFPVDDPTQVHAVFLSGAPPALDTASLLPDRVAPGPGVLYVSYADGVHRSKAARLLSDKRLPVVASARNWRTVLALRELARG